MAEKGKSTLDMNTVMESPPVNNGRHAPTDVAPPSQTQHVVNADGVGSASGDLAKKRRGRPRKFDAAGNLLVPPVSVFASPPVSVVTPPPLITAVASPPPVSQVVSRTLDGFTLSHSSDNSTNRARGRGRGRPPGSGNWQVLASLGGLFADSAAAADFRAHVIDVYAGEDVTGKIMSLTQGGPRGICVLSANGTVYNVALHQPGYSGGVISYEGQFEILSLTGSFTISEVGGVKRRTGRFSVSLAGPQGQVIGGGVAGPLVAASPIQTVVGTFLPNAYKNHKRKQQSEASMVSPIQSISHGEAHGQINRVGPHPADGNRAEEPAEQKPSPDINMAAPDE